MADPIVVSCACGAVLTGKSPELAVRALRLHILQSNVPACQEKS